VRVRRRKTLTPTPEAAQYWRAMSQGNIELILQQADAVNRRDADAFVATAHPDVEWEDSAFWSEVARVYRGRAALREWFNEIIVEPWESLRVEIAEITETDDRVFFGLLLTARGKDSGAETHRNFWSVYWIADGKVARREVFLERAEAAQAAGLSDQKPHADS
jgi:ketosteroid isomerase-like protein